MQLALQMASKARPIEANHAISRISPQERLAQIFGDHSICSQIDPTCNDQVLTHNTEGNKPKLNEKAIYLEFENKTLEPNRETLKVVKTPFKLTPRNIRTPGIRAQQSQAKRNSKQPKKSSKNFEENSSRSLNFMDDQFVTSTPVGKQHMTDIRVEETNYNSSFLISSHVENGPVASSLATSPFGIKADYEFIPHGRTKKSSKEVSICENIRNKTKQNKSYNLETANAICSSREHDVANIRREGALTDATKDLSISNTKNASSAKKGEESIRDTQKKHIPRSSFDLVMPHIELSQHNYDNQPSLKGKSLAIPSAITSTKNKLQTEKAVETNHQTKKKKRKSLVHLIDAGSLDLQSHLRNQLLPPRMGILAILPSNPSKKQIRALFEKIQKKCLPGPDPLNLLENARIRIQSRD